jgi:hypothetical protein
MKPLQVREMREDQCMMQVLGIPAAMGRELIDRDRHTPPVVSQAKVQTVGYELPAVDLLLLALVSMARVSRVNAYAIV